MAVGGGDEYLWLGSTDHGNSSTDTMYRGYSAAQDTPPTSWTLFEPPGGFFQNETPHFVYDPDEARPFRLYYHPQHSDSGGQQQTRLASYASDWTSGTDEGEMLPATANPAGTDPLIHTGYAVFERRTATDWHAWSLTRNTLPATYGHWTSSDGETWTCANDDLDATTGATAVGRELVITNLNRVTIGATEYAVMVERPLASAGGGGAVPGGTVVICEMTDDETFVNASTIWSPITEGTIDNVRNVRAVQDATDPALIHLYVHVDKETVYYATHTVA